MDKSSCLKSLAVAVLVSAGSLSPVYAGSIELDVIIRDFTISHPDFGSYLGGLETGMVGSVLGPDGDPVYAAGAGQITSAASFSDWYDDVAGVNLSTTKTLTLSDADDDGVYTYDNASFFPINGELFGDSGYAGNNYYFTLEMRTEFTYEAGQEFSFRGDDDIWVFINKSLVIDLGGVHGPADGSINLDTLGLTAGDTYDLDLFFAERRETGSSFKIETSIASLVTADVPEPGMLTLLGLGLLGLGTQRRKLKLVS